MDKRYLDALRQGTGNVPFGIVPYAKTLPVASSSFLTHHQQVHGLSHIASASTRMESTSLVLAWGVDIFFCHVQPADAFDMVSQDFDTLSLLGTVGTLIVLTLGSRSIFRKRKLATAWK
jgi:ER membrane protein complex subunit 1